MENRRNEMDENQVERVPAPVVGGNKPKKIRWWQALVAVALAFVLFAGGAGVFWLSLDPEMRDLIRVKNRVQKDYYQEVTDEEFYAAIFGGINEDILDAYSEYMTGEQLRAMLSDMDGNRIGIGVAFRNSAHHSLRLALVCGNSPAEEAGLKVDDQILGVGESVETITSCATYEEFSALLAPFGEGEKFVLWVEDADGDRRHVELSKQAYVESYVSYRDAQTAFALTGKDAMTLTERGEKMSYLDNYTAYIKLSQFTGNAEAGFAKCMELFKERNKKNLVLDLRGNGGGYLDTMQAIAGYFLKNTDERTPVVATADFGDRKESYRAKGNYYDKYFSEDSRIVVLADSGSASASECLIGSMIDYGAISYADICLAEREGVCKTYGKGIMQETKILSPLTMSALKLTTAEIRWPVSNHSIHGRGVLPEDGTKTVVEHIRLEEETRTAILQFSL